jgi:hypothetical protein
MPTMRYKGNDASLLYIYDPNPLKTIFTCNLTSQEEASK